MTELVEYVDEDGASPFGDWFAGLAPQPAAKIVAALTKLEFGNMSNVKGVGGGVLEQRIDFGPGYRVYFGKDGDAVILLAGGTKRRQQKDIDAAHQRWAECKGRKRG